ncbi:MAG: PHP domain-containing protein, partial [bacterium]
PHVALALLEAGYVDTFDQAFGRYLGQRAPAFVAKPHFQPEEAIELIRQAGGVSVLAHPGTANRDDLLPRLVAAGLSGIEAWHPKHGPGQVAHYRRVAAEYDLVPSGGSDFHGAKVGDVRIGMSDVPGSTLDDLLARR